MSKKTSICLFGLIAKNKLVQGDISLYGRRGCMTVAPCQLWGHSHITPPRSAISAGSFNKKEIIIALKGGSQQGENLQALILSLYVPKPIVVMA